MKNGWLFAVLAGAAVATGCGAPTHQGGMAARPAASAVDDSVVSTRVESALASNRETAALKIGVSTENGRVTLKGDVKSMAVRKKIDMIVRGVDGVRSLDNQLIITG